MEDLCRNKAQTGENPKKYIVQESVIKRAGSFCDSGDDYDLCIYRQSVGDTSGSDGSGRRWSCQSGNSEDGYDFSEKEVSGEKDDADFICGAFLLAFPGRSG